MLQLHVHINVPYRWDVKCCRILTVCMEHCYLTEFRNDFQQNFDYTADNDGVFVGLHSVFSSFYQ